MSKNSKFKPVVISTFGTRKAWDQKKNRKGIFNKDRVEHHYQCLVIQLFTNKSTSDAYFDKEEYEEWEKNND